MTRSNENRRDSNSCSVRLFFVPCVPWLVGDDYKGNFPMKEESL